MEILIHWLRCNAILSCSYESRFRGSFFRLLGLGLGLRLVLRLGLGIGLE
jgi:cytochrome b